MAGKYMLHQIFLPKKPGETGSLKISVMHPRAENFEL
jgi:hypothetical protein